VIYLWKPYSFSTESMVKILLRTDHSSYRFSGSVLQYNKVFKPGEIGCFTSRDLQAETVLSAV
jgi:hypothetical protein